VERLISFLSHNFYFVIMIVGIIYTMFFRKSPLERPPNRMPDFGGEGFPRPRRPGETRAAGRPNTRPEAEKLPSPRPAVPTETRRQPEWMDTRGPQPRNAQPEQRQKPQHTETGWPPPRVEQPAMSVPMTIPELPDERSSDIDRRVSQDPRVSFTEPAQLSAPPRQTEHTRETHSPTDLTQQDLTRAVMWAEILGPPRARRPHRR
jgi:hypothetical protein